MRLFKSSTIIPFICILALLAGAVGLQHRMIQDFRSQNPQYRDALYLPSSEYVRWVTLGYDQFVSDFLWLRMIQTFAAGWSRPENAGQMWNYFDTISDIDPKHSTVYSFAMMAMGEESRRADMAYDVTDKYMLNNPYRFRIPFEAAFYASDWAGDTDLALYYLEMAGTDPISPGYIDRWKVHLHTRGGQFALAFEKMLTDTVLEADPKYMNIFELKRRKLINVLNDWWKWEIKNRAIEWKDLYGFLPTVEQLEQAGKFEGIELPDVHRVLGLVEAVISGQVEIPSNEVEIQRFAQSSIVAHPTLPYSAHDWLVDYMLRTRPREFEPIIGELKGYLTWPSVDEEHEKYVISRLEAAETLQMLVGQVRNGADVYEKQYGHCPESFTEFFPSMVEFSEPFGGEWVWFQDLCDVAITSYPEYIEVNLPKF